MMLLIDQIEIIKRHQANPPVHVVPIAEEFGIGVFKAKGWTDDLSGMIKKRASGDGYDIYVNANHHEHRRRFTIAHELGHFLLHRDRIGNGIVDDVLYRSVLSNALEAQANKMAAAILMPWHLLDPLLGGGITDIRKLAQMFLVSESAMSIRLGVPYENNAPMTQDRRVAAPA